MRAEMLSGDPPERSAIEQQPIIDHEAKKVIVDSIYTLKLCLEADITAQNPTGLNEPHYKAAFNDKEQSMIKSKIFKLIAKL
jgi:hypothetical protein